MRRLQTEDQLTIIPYFIPYFGPKPGVSAVYVAEIGGSLTPWLSARQGARDEGLRGTARER